MTAPASGDVRGFYTALGIELPTWCQREAPVRCFANAEAHHHGDRSPSCSVNLASGAWNCHGCGAAGGAYDAAIAFGHTPRSAMNLLIAHGLAEPRGASRASRSHRREVASASRSPSRRRTRRPTLRADDSQVQSWAGNLEANARLLWRLLRERAWSHRVIQDLQIGFDGTRITIPIRGHRGELRGVLRYDPFGSHAPKMRALPGTGLGLLPHPACERSREILLVEGPPDMIAARSCSLAAIAIPGTSAWRPAWAHLLAGRRITIVMDCDEPGRRAAQRIATALEPVAATVEVIDLWPERNDGYDLTDRIVERRKLISGLGRAPRSVETLLAQPPGSGRQRANSTAIRSAT